MSLGLLGTEIRNILMTMVLWDGVLQGIESSGSEYSDREIALTRFCSDTHHVF